MKIKFFSDTICGWCFIGYHRLLKALKKSKEKFQIIHIPFQLNPNLSSDGIVRDDYIMQKFGSVKNAKPMYDQMVLEALKENLILNLNAIKKTPNTVLSHILIDYSKRYNLQEKILYDIFFNYFGQGVDIGSIVNLIKIGAKHGINEKELEVEFNLHKNKKKIYQMDIIGREMGITGVPIFIFNNKVTLSGVQSMATITEAINEAK